MKKNASLIFLVTAIFLFGLGAMGTVSAASSVTATASATPTDAQTTQNLKQRIDAVLKNKSDQVKGVIDDLTMQKRGFIAVVVRVIEQTVTVKDDKGSQTFVITPDVVLVKDNKKATIDDIAVDDSVIALGYQNGQDFQLKRLIISSTPLVPAPRDTVVGTLQTINRTQLQLLPRSSQDMQTFSINKNTQYEDAQEQSLTFKDIQTDNQYLVISFIDQNNKIATLIHAIGTISVPTPSPKPTNSPTTARRLPSPTSAASSSPTASAKP